MAYLTSFPGIGAWTAKMTLIFTLGRPDVLPFEDGAFMRAYRWLYHARSSRPATVGRRCRTWCPYSSTAARYLYRALDSGLVTSCDSDEVVARHAGGAPALYFGLGLCAFRGGLMIRIHGRLEKAMKNVLVVSGRARLNGTAWDETAEKARP